MNTGTNATHATEGRGTARLGRAGAWMLAAAIAGIASVVTQHAEAQESVPPPPQAQVQVQAPPPSQVVVVPAQPQPQPVYIQQAQPYPQGYVVAQPGYAPVAQPLPPPRRSNGHIGLIISGAVLLGVGWISNFIVGLPAGDQLFSGGPRPEWDAFRYSSLIPVVGPWVQLGVKPTAFNEDDWAVWLILNGLMQAAGTSLLVAGIATSGDDGGSADAGGGVQFVVLPNAGRDHAGLTLAGSF